MKETHIYSMQEDEYRSVMEYLEAILESESLRDAQAYARMIIRTFSELEESE